MIVSSAQLTIAADIIRERGVHVVRIPAEQIDVSAAQLDTAARILREAEPSVCNGRVAERPGFIDAREQDDPEVLTLTVGILPTTAHRIGRDGEIR